MSDDTRVTCNTCRNFRGGWCQCARAALMSRQERAQIGPALASLPQHCPAYVGRV